MDYENVLGERKFPTYEQLKTGLLQLIDEGKISREDASRLLPELRESEEERIKRDLIEYLKGDLDDITTDDTDRWINWIEKQKENPKSADSISEDCTSDANSKDRWHKTANSLPDNGRDVLAKDALGNHLLASFDGAQWFVSVYDGEDHSVLHTPPILEWCEIPSEKQKEQKPAEWSEEDKNMWTHLNGYLNGFSCSEDAIKQIADWFYELPNRFNLQPKQEWSEEDEKMFASISNLLWEGYGCFKENKIPTPEWSKIRNWLKSLRPQPNWKPNEEQIDALKNVIRISPTGENNDILISLFNDLKKLM